MIHRREAPWSLRAAYRIADQPDIADDVIQDALIQVWHEWSQLQTTRPVIALYGSMIPLPRFGDGGKMLEKNSDGEKNVRNEARAAEFFVPLS
jgi:Sigma-70 region 2